jgi:hypothetical protein
VSIIDLISIRTVPSSFGLLNKEAARQAGPSAL